MLYSGIWIVKLRKQETFVCTFSIPAENRRTDLTNRGQKFYRFSHCVQSVYTVNISFFLPSFLHFFVSFLLFYSIFYLFIVGAQGYSCPWELCITYTHTFCKTVVDKRLTCRRDLYLTTHITHRRQISLKPDSFEPTIPGSERPQTHALNRAATEIGSKYSYITKHK